MGVVTALLTSTTGIELLCFILAVVYLLVRACRPRSARGPSPRATTESSSTASRTLAPAQDAAALIDAALAQYQASNSHLDLSAIINLTDLPARVISEAVNAKHVSIRIPASSPGNIISPLVDLKSITTLTLTGAALTREALGSFRNMPTSLKLVDLRGCQTVVDPKHVTASIHCSPTVMMSKLQYAARLYGCRTCGS